MEKIQRCPWANPDNPLYLAYHDHEWSVPTLDDRELFELLILEGAQAGLSWETILNKREHYREAFDHFDVQKVARYDEAKTAALLQNPGIIRNRRKIRSAIGNAGVFVAIQEAYGSFARYLWDFVDHTPIINHFETLEDVPAKTPLSETISKDLKARGMTFVGPTIIYALMQSAGMVNDHLTSCFKHRQHHDANRVK